MINMGVISRRAAAAYFGAGRSLHPLLHGLWRIAAGRGLGLGLLDGLAAAAQIQMFDHFLKRTFDGVGIAGTQTGNFVVALSNNVTKPRTFTVIRCVGRCNGTQLVQHGGHHSRLGREEFSCLTILLMRCGRLTVGCPQYRDTRGVDTVYSARGRTVLYLSSLRLAFLFEIASQGL